MLRLDTKNFRSSTNLPYCRIVGYLVTLAMHCTNTSIMLGRIDPDETDPNLRHFGSIQTRFITCWTFVAQIIYAAIGLSCDVLTLLAEGKEYSILKSLKYCRDIMMASVVAPYSLFIPTVFWPLFLFDRELILPVFTTKIVDAVSNHVIHTAIIPVVLWEIAFQPRDTPKSHKQNLLAMTGYTAFYLTVLMYTFFEMGSFPYPILTMLYGSVYFYLFLAFAISWLPFYYALQWKITDLFWNQCKKIE